MAGALLGGAFLTAFIDVLVDRMASPELMNYFRGQKLYDNLLQRLKMSLLTVNTVLNDADEKQITEPAVKVWLDELKDAIYDAEDILDEIATEASRIKVWNFASSSLNPFADNMKSKVSEIVDRLEYITKQKDILGLEKVIRATSFLRLPTNSLVHESQVVGRDGEKEEIINLLLLDDQASSNNINVITVMGMGGLGKTTLAQLVYNDESVEQHFDLKAWVYVSEEFDVKRVTKLILQIIKSSSPITDDLNMLQVELKQRFD